MSEENNQIDSELFDGEEEKDTLLAIRMGLYDQFMKNWKYLVMITVVVLIYALVDGLLDSRSRSIQRDISGDISKITNKLPAPDPRSRYGLVPADNPKDTKKMKKLKDAAAKLETVAQNASGVGKVLALQQSALVWKRAGELEKQQSTLQKAIDSQPDKILLQGLQIQLADSYFEAKKYDEAATIYASIIDNESHSYAKQRAQLSQLLTLEANGKIEEARGAHLKLLTEATSNEVSSDRSSFLSELTAIGLRLGVE